MTTKKALLIPFDETLPVTVVEVERDSLDAIYDLCAPESRCFTVLGGDDYSMYGDDEGLLRADAGHRVNARAMQLYAASEGAGIDDFMSPLVGDWLVFGGVDAEGETGEVTVRVLNFRFSWTARVEAPELN